MPHFDIQQILISSGVVVCAGEEGWMLAFAPEHGQLLQPREAKADAELWWLMH